MPRRLTQEEIDLLPAGTRVRVMWDGGDGPHEYRVVNKSGHVCADNAYSFRLDTMNVKWVELVDDDRTEISVTWPQRRDGESDLDYAKRCMEEVKQLPHEGADVLDLVMALIAENRAEHEKANRAEKVAEATLKMLKHFGYWARADEYAEYCALRDAVEAALEEWRPGAAAQVRYISPDEYNK